MHRRGIRIKISTSLTLLRPVLCQRPSPRTSATAFGEITNCSRDRRRRRQAIPQLPLQRGEVRLEHVTSARLMLAIACKQRFEPLTADARLGGLPRRAVAQRRHLRLEPGFPVFRARARPRGPGARAMRARSGRRTAAAGPRQPRHAAARALGDVGDRRLDDVAADPRRFAISFSMRRRRRAELTSTTSRDPFDAKRAERGVVPVLVLPIAGLDPGQGAPRASAPVVS